MSHLTESMVERFFEREKEDARRVLRKEMDSCMDTIFKQMKRKLMHLVESGRGGDETGHGLAHLGDPVDREQLQHSSLNGTKSITSTSINSRAQLSDLNASNQSFQGGLNDLVYYGQQQLYLIMPTSTNQTHVPVNANSNQSQDDEIIVKNELEEIVNIIPNESIPSSSTQSQQSNEQSNNDNIDDLFDELDEEDCDCPDCSGDLFIKIEEDDVDVQLIEDVGENENSNFRPCKRQRRETNHPEQVHADNKPDSIIHFFMTSVKCDQCSRVFQNTELLKIHLKSVHSIEKYRCLHKDCSESFDKQPNFVHHCKTVHQAQPNAMYPCGYCSVQFKSHRSLVTHNLYRHQEGTFRCSHVNCQFVGELRHTVYNHHLTTHKELVCQYPSCGRRYKNASKLKDHERTHRNVKPFLCKWPQCKFASAYMNNTLVHIRKHLEQNQDGNLHSTEPKDYLEVLHNFV